MYRRVNVQSSSFRFVKKSNQVCLDFFVEPDPLSPFNCTKDPDPIEMNSRYFGEQFQRNIINFFSISTTLNHYST